MIDASDGFSLEVEVSAGDREGSDRTFAFSAFGLSEIDPTDGALAIRPSTGFNGTIVDPSGPGQVLGAATDGSLASTGVGVATVVTVGLAIMSVSYILKNTTYKRYSLYESR